MFAVLSFVLAVVAVPFKSKRRLEAGLGFRYTQLVADEPSQLPDPALVKEGATNGPPRLRAFSCRT